MDTLRHKAASEMKIDRGGRVVALSATRLLIDLFIVMGAWYFVELLDHLLPRSETIFQLSKCFAGRENIAKLQFIETLQ